jgi:hypothetical protein
LSSLLLEEINEIESIYHIISKQLVGAHGVLESKELIDAIRAKVDAGINELEWIRRDITKGLRMLSQKDKRAYKILYILNLTHHTYG